MNEMVKLTQSGEDYIEAIVMLAGKENTPVRSVDLALKLGVSKPSVNKAILMLKDQGLVEQAPYGDIYLTEEGFRYGSAILYRHMTLTSFLADMLGVEPILAEKEACKIEHCISQDTFERWAKLVNETVQQ